MVALWLLQGMLYQQARPDSIHSNGGGSPSASSSNGEADISSAALSQYLLAVLSQQGHLHSAAGSAFSPVQGHLPCSVQPNVSQASHTHPAYFPGEQRLRTGHGALPYSATQEVYRASVQGKDSFTNNRGASVPAIRPISVGATIAHHHQAGGGFAGALPPLGSAAADTAYQGLQQQALQMLLAQHGRAAIPGAHAEIPTAPGPLHKATVQQTEAQLNGLQAEHVARLLQATRGAPHSQVRLPHEVCQ